MLSLRRKVQVYSGSAKPDHWVLSKAEYNQWWTLCESLNRSKAILVPSYELDDSKWIADLLYVYHVVGEMLCKLGDHFRSVDPRSFIQICINNTTLIQDKISLYDRENPLRGLRGFMQTSRLSEKSIVLLGSHLKWIIDHIEEMHEIGGEPGSDNDGMDPPLSQVRCVYNLVSCRISHLMLIGLV